jgi:DNA-binding response OmpR family regulator
MTRWLSGKSVLVVEDEFVIGLMLVQEIGRAGGTAIGPATSVADALKAIESQIVDLVILDAKLADG